MSGFFFPFLAFAYLAAVLVAFLRGAERMHRHPSGNRGFVADVALSNLWLAPYAAAAGTVLAVAPAMDGVTGWLAPNAAGLAAAILFSMLPPVAAARRRLKALVEAAA